MKLSDDERYMREALRLARKAYGIREVPIGCVIVYEGKIIGRGYNKRTQKGNVLCSEMECATLFVVAAVRGCRAGAIMNWGDMDKTIRIACDALRSLIAADREQG